MNRLKLNTDMFQTTLTETIVEEISINKLDSFKGHPFKLYEGEKLEEMKKSIKELGVVNPIIVRSKKDGKYEILSGHNRVNASKLLGKKTVPAIIKNDLSESEAELIVVETNVAQRGFSELRPSEKARAIHMRHEAMKKQGIRKDLIKDINEYMKNLTNETIANEYEMSSRNISRFLRIYKLEDSLKEKLDENRFALNVAVDLSYLKFAEQKNLNSILDENNYKINLTKSNKLKEESKVKKLNKTNIINILEEDSNITKKTYSFKITKRLKQKYFKDIDSEKEMNEIIMNALDKYLKSNK